jgi:hypothetical protein
MQTFALELQRSRCAGARQLSQWRSSGQACCTALFPVDAHRTAIWRATRATLRLSEWLSGPSQAMVKMTGTSSTIVKSPFERRGAQLIPLLAGVLGHLPRGWAQQLGWA